MDKVWVVVTGDSGPFSYIRRYVPAVDGHLRRHGLVKEVPADLWERFQRIERELQELEAQIEQAAAPSSLGESNA